MKGIKSGGNRGKNVYAAKGASPTRVVAGQAGKSFVQSPMPGPTNPGQPVAMKRALTRKSVPSKGL